MENPRHWRLNKQRYALVGNVCTHCSAKLFPPREVCPHCGNGAYQQEAAQQENLVAMPLRQHAAAD